MNENEDEVLVELRFGDDAQYSIDECLESLKTLDVEMGETARDPSIVAALTVAAAATTLTIELVKLAKELRTKRKEQKILIVMIDKNNEEKSIHLLEASGAEIEEFVSSD